MGTAATPSNRADNPGDDTGIPPRNPGDPTEFDLRAEALADSEAENFYDNDDGWPPPPA
ncbi:hypothetical protein [Nocardia sp. NPDC050406]|uniref:hypothetical protein n=1 Tax=Nocardia sp. NPDC050406 TaxID=3364318 RepID=UPI0037AD61BE